MTDHYSGPRAKLLFAPAGPVPAERMIDHYQAHAIELRFGDLLA